MTDKPCCAAEALRRIRQVKINGIMTGITMFDECVGEVKAEGLHDEAEIRAALMKRVKVFNYVPPNVEEEYARVLLDEYHKPAG